MSGLSESNRVAWNLASRKYVEEPHGLDTERLADVELRLLGRLLANGPRVIHLQSGNGVDAIELLTAGARSAIGVDFSSVAVAAATARAARLRSGARYVVGAVPATPLVSACADVVYTGKGAVMWLSDLDAWAREISRLLAPGGSLFIYDAHPAAPLWTRDADHTALEPGRSYFGGTRANDTFPASAIARFGGHDVTATEWQWTLAEQRHRRWYDHRPPRRTPRSLLAARRRARSRRVGRAAAELVHPDRARLTRAR